MLSSACSFSFTTARLWKAKGAVAGAGRIYGLGCPVLSRESSESDRLFNRWYGVGAKVLCHLQKHRRLVYSTQNSNNICLSLYRIFQPEIYRRIFARMFE